MILSLLHAAFRVFLDIGLSSPFVTTSDFPFSPRWSFVGFFKVLAGEHTSNGEFHIFWKCCNYQCESSTHVTHTASITQWATPDFNHLAMAAAITLTHTKQLGAKCPKEEKWDIEYYNFQRASTMKDTRSHCVAQQPATTTLTEHHRIKLMWLICWQTVNSLHIHQTRSKISIHMELWLCPV